MNNLIFDIKEFGLHDGSGMRTTVFLKGCPLKCTWCHNPEGQSFTKEITKNPLKCTSCGLCQRKCNHETCKDLNLCVKICPTGALSFAEAAQSSVERRSSYAEKRHDPKEVL